MWLISNNKGVDGEVKSLRVKNDVNKLQNNSGSGIITEYPHYWVDPLIKKLNYKGNNAVKVKRISIKSNMDKQQNISENTETFGQFRCRAGASIERYRYRNPCQKGNRTRSECQFNVNVFCDDRRTTDYRTSKKSSPSYVKNQLKSKRPSTDPVKQIVDKDIQKGNMSKNNISKQQQLYNKLQQIPPPKPNASFYHKLDYYNYNNNICNWKQNKKVQAHKKNKQTIIWQQSSEGFLPYVNEVPLSNCKQACVNTLTTQQKNRSPQWEERKPQQVEEQRRWEDRQPPRVKRIPHQEEQKLKDKKQKPQQEERKTRQKERQQRQTEREITNIRRTEDELARVKIQRLHLLKCIEHHQRALATETRQLLKNQCKQRRLREDDENEKLEEMQKLMDYQYSQRKPDHRYKVQKQNEPVSFICEQNKSTPKMCNRNRPTKKELLITPKKLHQSEHIHQPTEKLAEYLTNMDESSDDNKRQFVSSIPCEIMNWKMPARPKGRKTFVSPPRLDSVSVNLFDDYQEHPDSTSTNCIRGRAGVDTIPALPPQQRIQCNCVINLPNDMNHETAGTKSASFPQNNSRYRRTKSKTFRTGTVDTNNTAVCVTRPSSFQSKLKRFQPYFKMCDICSVRSKSSTINHD